MEKEILHIDSYIPQGEPTWIYYNGNLELLEQIRVVTKPNKEWGYDCHCEYVFVDSMGMRQVHSKNSFAMIIEDHYTFVGNVITKSIFEGLYSCELKTLSLFDRPYTLNRQTFYGYKLEHIEDWPQLSFEPALLDYCKEKDALDEAKK